MLESELAVELKLQILDGAFDLLATEVLGYQVEDFHVEILRFAMALRRENGEGILLAPRGFGKSTIGNVVICIGLILINPNIRILISSSTQSKAESFLKEIKAQFEQNQRLHQIFGIQANSAAWKNAEINVIDRTKIAKESTLSAHGQSGAVVSKHYDVHIVDDAVNEDNARTKGQRDKLADWIYMSLDPTLEPHGFRLWIGTRYHPDDQYGRMIKQSEEETKEDEDEEDGESNELRPLRVMVLQAIQNEGTSTEKSLWEDKFKLIKLKRKRSRMGTLRFNAQYQNQTDLMKGKIFKDEYFEYFEREELKLGDLKIVQGVDLNASKGDTNDFFALTTKAYDAMSGKA